VVWKRRKALQINAFFARHHITQLTT